VLNSTSTVMTRAVNEHVQDPPARPAGPMTQRIGLPQGGDTALSNVMHTDVLVGDPRSGETWHALMMCLSEADAIVFILDWSVGPARERERARKELALPPPLRSPS
jgi:hypothetical protein